MAEKKQKKKCKYEDCPRMALMNDEFCIFHSKDIEGKKADFDEKFLKEFERQKENEKEYNFSGFVFPNIRNFERTEFIKKAIFKNAEFFGGAKFQDTKFSENVDFENAKFFGEGEIDFRKSKFFGTVQLDNSKFWGNVNFHGSKFDEEVAFRHMRFYGKADFEKVVFSSKTTFNNIRFFKETKFCEAQFSGNVEFFKVKFFEEINFVCAEFSKKVEFWKVDFFGKADFFKSKFFGDVDFYKDKFFGETHFWLSKFHQEASFKAIQFYKKFHFFYAEFAGSAKFEDFTLKEYDSFKVNNTYFFDVDGLFEFIKKNEKEFKYQYVKKIPFKKRPAKKKIELIKINLIRKKKPIPKFLKKKIAYIVKTWKFFLKKIIRITEFLPENFTLILGEKVTARYPIISRKIKDDMYLLGYKKNRSLIQIPLWWLWWLLADFGRSFLRWAISSMIFASLFALIFHFGIGPESFCIKSLPKTSFLTMLYYSIVTFTTLGFGDITPTTTGASILVMLEVILGYIMLGGLISIFANKLARRS